MPWVKIAKPLLPAVLACGLHQSAWSQSLPILKAPDLDSTVFTKGEVDRLCEWDGKRFIVSRPKLAWRLLQLASPFDKQSDQDRLLPQATAPDAPPAAGVTDTQVIRFVAREKPFRDLPFASYTQEQKNAVARQASVRWALRLWLSEADSPDSNKNFRLERPIDPLAPVDAYFYGDGPQIVCRKGRVSGGEDGGQSGASGGVKTQPILRQDVTDISATDLKKAKGARFTYEDDAEKGKTSLAVEGLVGIAFSGAGMDLIGERRPGEQTGPLYWFKLTPYLYYKSSHKRPEPATTKDIDYIAPGIAGDLIWLNAANTFGFNLQLEGSKTVDTANASDVYNAGIRFSPSFHGGALSWIGGVVGVPGLPLLLKTDLALLARQHFIEDAGKNPELQGVESYFGAGVDTLLSIYLDDKTGGVLSKLVGTIGYRYQYNSSGVVDIERFTAGLSYEIGSNATAGISYVNGRDVNTLQLEEKWTAGLTLKY